MTKDETGSVRLFLLSDLHVGSRKGTEETVRAGLKNMAALDSTAMYVINGDITTAGKVSQYQTVWNLLSDCLPRDADVIMSLGNHDVRGPYPADWNNYQESDPTYFREIVVPEYNANFLNSYVDNKDLYYSSIHGCYQFIVLNSEKGLKDSAYLSFMQLQWLERRLTVGEQAGLVNVLIVHQALRDTHWRSNFGGGFGVQDAVVKDILRKHLNTFVLSGHIHNGFGVCEVIERDFGTCIDQPAYTVSENGYVGQGLGYYCNFSASQMHFEAWDFVTMTEFPEYSFTLKSLTLASAVSQAPDGSEMKVFGAPLLSRYYDQRLFNDPSTDSATAAPDEALYPSSLRAEIQLRLNDITPPKIMSPAVFNLSPYRGYQCRRDSLIALLEAQEAKFSERLKSVKSAALRLSLQAGCARVERLFENIEFFSDQQLGEEYEVLERLMTAPDLIADKTELAYLFNKHDKRVGSLSLIAERTLADVDATQPEVNRLVKRWRQVTQFENDDA